MTLVAVSYGLARIGSGDMLDVVWFLWRPTTGRR